MQCPLHSWKRTSRVLDTPCALSLVEIILHDWLQARLSGGPRKRLLDMLMPNGKTLAECTGKELKAVDEAYSALWPR
jgi:hypothetical protein